MRSSPLSLILVRNTVTHDARVLREAVTLRDLGFEVLIAGVVSSAELETELQIEGFRVLRLSPASLLRGVLGRAPASVAAGSPAAPAALRAGNGGQRAPRAGAGRARRAVLRLRRLAVTLAYYRQGIALARRTSPVLVHANDYNTMWIAVAAKLLCGSRLIYDCHELWPDRNGRPEWRAWLLACEALFVRIADVTITTSPGYGSAIAERYRVRSPIVVRNIPAAPQPARSAPVDERERADGHGAVTYVGGLMPGRGVEQAIEMLALVPEARLELIGPGADAYRATLAALAERIGVADRVTLQPPVAPALVLDAIAHAGIGLMLIQPICRSYELTLPNKLFEYAAVGLPMLASDLPVIGPFVRDEGLGEVVPATDIPLIAEGVRRLLEPDRNAAARERVRAFARRVTWERERAILERVYIGASGVERPGAS